MHEPTSGPAHYVMLAARSDLQLETVCEGLAVALGLPEFVYDAHSTWRYATSKGGVAYANVTKTDREDTLREWQSRCPVGMNYLLDFATEDAALAAALPQHVAAVLGCEPLML